MPTACPDPEMSLARSSEQVPHAQPRLQLSIYNVWYGTTFAVPQFAVSGGGSHVLGPQTILPYGVQQRGPGMCAFPGMRCNTTVYSY